MSIYLIFEYLLSYVLFFWLLCSVELGLGTQKMAGLAILALILCLWEKQSRDRILKIEKDLAETRAKCDRLR